MEEIFEMSFDMKCLKHFWDLGSQFYNHDGFAAAVVGFGGGAGDERVR
jgi:hypothetical protein